MMLHPSLIVVAIIQAKRATIPLPWDYRIEETLEAPTSSAPKSTFLGNQKVCF